MISPCCLPFRPVPRACSYASWPHLYRAGVGECKSKNGLRVTDVWGLCRCASVRLCVSRPCSSRTCGVPALRFATVGTTAPRFPEFSRTHRRTDVPTYRLPTSDFGIFGIGIIVSTARSSTVQDEGHFKGIRYRWSRISPASPPARHPPFPLRHRLAAGSGDSSRYPPGWPALDHDLRIGSVQFSCMAGGRLVGWGFGLVAEVRGAGCRCLAADCMAAGRSELAEHCGLPGMGAGSNQLIKAGTCNFQPTSTAPYLESGTSIIWKAQGDSFDKFRNRERALLPGSPRSYAFRTGHA